jgi:membrane-bound metal-dependent hydrolase YbcI (DUF457 family)
MYPLAHLAASLLLNETHHGDRLSAAAGTIAPDLMDKTLAWALGVTPSGRYAAHSLAGASAITLAVTWLAGPRRGASFGASYLCHLVADLWNSGHVPWLMPFKRYTYSEQRWDLGLTRGTLGLELVGLLLLARMATRWAAEGKR